MRSEGSERVTGWRRSRWLVPVALTLALGSAGIALLVFSEPVRAPSAPLPPQLRAHQTVEPSSGEGLPAEWWIPLAAGEAIQATVEQLGTDVVVELRRPGGEVVLTVDQPIGRFGREPVCFVETGGRGVILAVRPFEEDREEARSGSSPYRLSLEHRGPARQQDRQCQEATVRFFRVVQRFRSDGEVSEELLVEARRAGELWHRAGFRFEAAVVWAEMASIARAMDAPRREVRFRRAALSLLVPDETEGVGVTSLRALVLNDLGLTYHALGRVGQAEASYEEARGLYRQLGASVAEATVINNQARLVLARGRTHEAMELYRRVAGIAAREDARRLEAYARLNLGSTLAELGEFTRALDVLAEAGELFEGVGDAAGRASTSTAVGWVHTLAGREPTAVESFEEALALADHHSLKAIEAATRDRLGTALRRLGRLGAARQAYRRALELSRSMGRRRDEAHVLANLGWLEVEAGQHREAVHRLDQAYRLLEALEDPDALSYVLAGLARAYRGQGRLEEALEKISEATELVEVQRSLARGRGRRVLGVPLWPDYEALLRQVLMDLHAVRPHQGYDRQAFERADRARARHLYETLQDALADLDVAVAPELLAHERRLQEEIRAAQQRLAEVAESDGTGGGDKASRRLVRRRLGELEDVRSAIRRSSPRLAALRDPKPVSVEEVQGLLDHDTTLVSYHLGEEASHAFVVGRGTFESVELPPRAEIERLARAVYQGLKTRRSWGSQLELTGRRLSETVLAPVVPLLSGHRLVVAADGFLRYIPFTALPWPGGEGEPSREALVLDHREVVSVPSATVLQSLDRMRRGRWRIPGSIAVLADPVYDEDGPLPPLPFSRREARAIRDSAGASRKVRLLLGPEARAGPIRRGEVDGAEVIHFASHALIDEQDPELSRIVLSQLGGEGEDGTDLFLHEIYDLELTADLVVLSGCRTALGEAVRGEGLVGLTRGFFFAGAPRLVVSLWSVDDEATAVLMEHFYKALFAGIPPPAALVHAQQQTRRIPGWSDPFYWAGFVLQGDWR